MAVARIQQVRAAGRVQRNPQHSWHLRHKPWAIQPFCIAPVLPGETLKNLLMQARVVSDPVKNPLIGWHIEYYWFYVKLRDLDEREAFTQMLLDPEWDSSAVDAPAAVVEHYWPAGTGYVNWVDHCLRRVTEEYFRYEGEAAMDYAIINLPAASITRQSWLDSAVNDAVVEVPSDVDVDANADDTITAGEVDKALRMWRFQVANGMTDQSYEDWLRTFGISVPAEEIHRPELIRYIKEWTYPSNTINPATGAPSSALSWSIQERADKDRFFREPGFICGYTVARPKVYLGKQAGYGAMLMNNALSWLPAVMRDDPWTSMTKVAAASGPLNGNTDAYWVDVKDLFLYGDQFVNFAISETDYGSVALPTSGLQKRYPTNSDANSLFVDQDVEVPHLIYVRQDGVATLNIMGAQQDTSPTV